MSEANTCGCGRSNWKVRLVGTTLLKSSMLRRRLHGTQAAAKRKQVKDQGSALVYAGPFRLQCDAEVKSKFTMLSPVSAIPIQIETDFQPILNDKMMNPFAAYLTICTKCAKNNNIGFIETTLSTQD